MSLRSLSLLAASFSLVLAFAATAAPVKHSRHHKSSGPALVVRGDQVSTAGLVDAVATAFAETGDGHLDVQPMTIAAVSMREVESSGSTAG